MKVVLAILGMGIGILSAQQPVVVPLPQQTAASTSQALAVSSASNQAAMNQILNQLYRQQFQLSVAAAQTAPALARPVIINQTVIAPRR